MIRIKIKIRITIRRSSRIRIRARRRRKGTRLDGIHVEPTVAVVVEKSDAPAHHLHGRRILARVTVIVKELESGRLGSVDKGGGNDRATKSAGRSWR
jgi:hypothetical protein